MKYHVLYNPLSGSGKTKETMEILGAKFGGENLHKRTALFRQDDNCRGI